MWISLIALAALQLYYVQEMIAAFVVLGAVFAIVLAAGSLVLWLDRATSETWDLADIAAARVRAGFRQFASLFSRAGDKRTIAEAVNNRSIERGTAIHV
jgi:hypothetical protein